MVAAPSLPGRPRAIRRPPPHAVPAEVAVAEAFVRLTGVDPTSVWATQSPPPRQRPAPLGAAAAPADPPKEPTPWERACRAARRVVRQAASWLYHRALRACLA